MSFTFDKTFRIEPMKDGGMVLQQSHYPDDEQFTKAFTNFDDLVEFLITEKRKAFPNNDI